MYEYPLLPYELVDLDLQRDVETKSLVTTKVKRGKPVSNFSRRQKILNQKQKPACVGVSVKLLADEYFKKSMSAMWIYNKAKYFDEFPGEAYAGTSINGACQMLKVRGVCEEYLFPYTQDTENEGAEENSKLYKIGGHFCVDKEMKEIKAAVLQKTLCTPIKVHSYFYTVPKDGIIDKDEYLVTEKRGSHAVAVTGWKTINGVEHIEIQNSWGTSWGDDGVCYMPFDLFRTISGRVYYIHVPGGGEKKSIVQKIIEILNLPFTLLGKLLKKMRNL